ncbi:hypothetical protein FEF26_14780 [Nesterenkonia salmonea]|uniref:Alpha/beta hydrolase n=1 Tax=Nesterenkonia salmonea TaxID=1804987 RepID=A0A5R9B8C3_9MICC|nr:hypothetical protein [Nesterenkonia salmonea]TLP92375.1 hypothetical protein FEF26_14780 [Nesterenkonia salmonea]
MKAKKTSASKLANVARSAWNAGQSLDPHERVLYTDVDSAGEKYDFIFVPKEESKRLVVFFSGDANRHRFDPPVFQRWSWSSKFPAHCLFFSDPALYHEESLGLAWYSGKPDGDYLDHIWSIVGQIAAKFSIDAEIIFSYASSGGGLPALRSPRYFPNINVIAINPRVSLWRHPTKWVSRFSNAIYGVKDLHEVAREERHKFTALDHDVLDNLGHMFLAQNVLDETYHQNHFLPLVEFINSSPNAHKLRTHTFESDAGHAGAEDRATFHRILRFMKGTLHEKEEAQNEPAAV